MEYEADSIEADVQAALAAQDTPEPVQAPEQRAPDDNSEGNEGRVRDEHGRFVAKTEKPASVAETAPAEVPQEPIKPTYSPPASWKATAKAKFNALDPEVQAEVLRREEEMNQGLAQSQTKAERANRLDAIFAPHRDRLTLAGIDEFKYVETLMKADEMLRGPQAQQALAQLARMYGIQPLAPQLDQNGQPVQTQQDHPLIQQLQQQVQNLESQLKTFSTSQEEAVMSEVRSEIEQFRQDPAHIYFENVKPLMKVLIESGQAKDLKDAYERACRADPEVWQVLQAEQVKPQSKTATRAGGPQVTGSPSLGNRQPVTNGAVNPTSTIEDDVRAALGELSGRV